ncbi:MAG: UbiA family prenyltransferase [Persicimonas sp.]
MFGFDPAKVTPDDPLPKRLWAFSVERFPLLKHGVLIAAYVSSNQFLAHALEGDADKVLFSVESLVGFLVIFGFFLHLRVFDEHKDYDEDCIHHPDRVLQRGVVTLTELKVLGGVAIAVQLVLCWLHSPGALYAWLIAFGFSLLMLVEFFCGKWLEKRFILYATSHLMVMPLLALVVYGIATGNPPWETPPWYWVYAFVGFFVMLNWEISRKIRAPEQEVDGLDSYTKQFGTYGAAWAVLGVRVLDTALVALVGWHLDLSWWFYAALVALFVVTLAGFVSYRRHPSPKNADRMEDYAGLYIVAFDVIVAVAIAHTLGFALM